MVERKKKEEKKERNKERERERGKKRSGKLGLDSLKFPTCTVS